MAEPRTSNNLANGTFTSWNSTTGARTRQLARLDPKSEVDRKKTVPESLEEKNDT